MPYPMTQAPTWAQFKTRCANEFGCTVQAVVGKTVKISNGHGSTIILLEDHERLTPSMIRNSCAKLGLDPKRFGLNLD